MKVNVIGNTDGIYINPRNCEAAIDPEYLKYAINYSEVNLDGANNAIVKRYDDKSIKIIQVGGYTCDRGLFCDMY